MPISRCRWTQAGLPALRERRVPFLSYRARILSPDDQTIRPKAVIEGEATRSSRLSDMLLLRRRVGRSGPARTPTAEVMLAIALAMAPNCSKRARQAGMTAKILLKAFPRGPQSYLPSHIT